VKEEVRQEIARLQELRSAERAQDKEKKQLKQLVWEVEKHVENRRGLGLWVVGWGGGCLHKGGGIKLGAGRGFKKEMLIKGARWGWGVFAGTVAQ
jgi:hypothetical protein